MSVSVFGRIAMIALFGGLAAGHECLGSQSFDNAPWRIAIAIGGTYRETRDYTDPAKHWGFSGDLSFEQQSSQHSSVVFFVTGSDFPGSSDVVNIIQPQATRAVNTLRGATKATLTMLDWPLDDEVNTNVSVVSTGVGFRRYLTSVETSGTFLGGGAGIAYLQSSRHNAIRPALTAIAGHVWQTAGLIRYFAEVRYTWAGLDLGDRIAAKSPRWFVAPAIGFSKTM